VPAASWCLGRDVLDELLEAHHPVAHLPQARLLLASRRQRQHMEQPFVALAHPISVSVRRPGDQSRSRPCGETRIQEHWESWNFAGPLTHAGRPDPRFPPGGYPPTRPRGPMCVPRPSMSCFAGCRSARFEGRAAARGALEDICAPYEEFRAETEEVVDHGCSADGGPGQWQAAQYSDVDAPRQSGRCQASD